MTDTRDLSRLMADELLKDAPKVAAELERSGDNEIGPLIRKLVNAIAAERAARERAEAEARGWRERAGG